MKRTDAERIERELKRVEKRNKLATKRDGEKRDGTVGSYIKELKSLLQHDGTMIYNTVNDEDVLELMIEMKDDLEERQWDVVIRKAVNSTKVKEREQAMDELRSLLE